jgi:hypothetical protein
MGLMDELMQRKALQDLGNIPNAFGNNVLASNQPLPAAPYTDMPSPLDRGPMPPDEALPPAAASSPAPIRAPAESVHNDPVMNDDGTHNDPVMNDDGTPQSSNPSSIKDLLITKDDLDKAENKKRMILGLGHLADGLASEQSWGGFMLGRTNPQADSSAYTNKLAAMADLPIEKKKILLAQQLKQPEMDFTMHASDPSSTVSQLMGSIMKAHIQNNQQLSDEQKNGMLKVTDGKSGMELNQLASEPLFKDMMANDKLFQTLSNKAEIAEAKRDQAFKMMNFGMQKWGMGQDRQDQRATAHNAAQMGRTENTAFSNVARDTSLLQMTGQSRNIAKGLEQINDPTHPPSWTQINEVAQDFAAALSGKAVSSDFKLKEIKKANLSQHLGDITANLTSNPDQPANPETVKFWINMGNRLDDVYGRQIKARGEYLRDHSPKHLAEVYRDAAQPFVDGSWKGASAPTGAAAPPKVGDVEDGHKFLGGNPADPKAWEEVK